MTATDIEKGIKRFQYHSAEIKEIITDLEIK